MKRMTKVLVLLLVAVLVATAAILLLRGKKQPTLGILQYVQHPALDAAREGFLKALADEGYVAGKNIRIDYQNGQGSQDTCSSIADKFIADKVDLVLGIATPSVLAMAGKTETIPILGTAVTDYVEAKAYLARQGWEIITETREHSSACRILTEKAARAQESSSPEEFMGIEYILTRGMEYADIAHRERKCFLLAVLSAVAQDILLDQAGG